MSTSDLSPRDFDRLARQQREQKAIEPAMDAKSKSEHIKEEMRLRKMFDDDAYFAELYEGIE